MENIFLALGSLYFAFNIYDHLIALYIAHKLSEHDKYCEDCAEQELINGIRKK